MQREKNSKWPPTPNRNRFDVYTFEYITTMSVVAKLFNRQQLLHFILFSRFFVGVPFS
jgi:hypothetical protein